MRGRERERARTHTRTHTPHGPAGPCRRVPRARARQDLARVRASPQPRRAQEHRHASRPARARAADSCRRARASSSPSPPPSARTHAAPTRPLMPRSREIPPPLRGHRRSAIPAQAHSRRGPVSSPWCGQLPLVRSSKWLPVGPLGRAGLGAPLFREGSASSRVSVSAAEACKQACAPASRPVSSAGDEGGALPLCARAPGPPPSPRENVWPAAIAASLAGPGPARAGSSRRPRSGP